jgi:dihydrofolate reductase
MQASAFIATSLDGYIARPDHRIDWLEDTSSDATEDYGYENFVKTVSTVVMGRKTFQKIMTFPEWPFQSQRVIVLSSTMKSVPDSMADQIQLYDGTSEELVNLLDAEGDSHIYVDGSRAIQSFIAAGLLTDITLTTVPLLIGEGIPLFGGPLPKDVRLTHVATRAYQNGFVQTHYLFT